MAGRVIVRGLLMKDVKDIRDIVCGVIGNISSERGAEAGAWRIVLLSF